MFAAGGLDGLHKRSLGFAELPPPLMGDAQRVGCRRISAIAPFERQPVLRHRFTETTQFVMADPDVEMGPRGVRARPGQGRAVFEDRQFVSSELKMILAS